MKRLSMLLICTYIYILYIFGIFFMYIYYLNKIKKVYLSPIRCMRQSSDYIEKLHDHKIQIYVNYSNVQNN